MHWLPHVHMSLCAHFCVTFTSPPPTASFADVWVAVRRTPPASPTTAPWRASLTPSTPPPRLWPRPAPAAAAAQWAARA